MAKRTGGSALSAWLRQRAGDAVEPVPAVVAAGESAVGLAARLVAAGAAEVVLVDAAGHAVGLVEAADLMPHLSPDSGGRAPPPGRRTLVAAEAPLVEAVARMRAEGRERAVVVDGAGRPIGLLRLAAALAAGFGALLPALERAAGGRPEAAEAKAAQPALAEAMLADGRGATDVQGVLAALNDRVAARLVTDALAAMMADGWGEPPVAFSLIQMGSAGRGESFLNPDQDHGFILADYADERHGTVDPWFIALAERLSRDLERAGYPFCDGNVMATNPLWRKPLHQWRDQVAYWTRARSNQAILQADIFFDFRPVYGPGELAAELRRYVTEAVRDARPFLAQMCWRQREQEGPPLSLLGHLTGDALDLKLWGSLPLTELVRILALAHGVAATGTRTRLDGLVDAGTLARDLHAALAEDLEFLAEMRLRRQLDDVRAGRAPENVIDPRSLSTFERQRLERLFRDLDRLRKRALGELLGVAA